MLLTSNVEFAFNIVNIDFTVAFKKVSSPEYVTEILYSPDGISFGSTIILFKFRFSNFLLYFLPITVTLTFPVAFLL